MRRWVLLACLLAAVAAEAAVAELAAGQAQPDASTSRMEPCHPGRGVCAVGDSEAAEAKTDPETEAGSPTQTDPDPDAQEQETGEGEDDTEEAQPVRRDGWKERVAVTAQIDGTTNAPLGASSTVIEPTLTAAPTNSLTEAVAEVPGVARNGQGGIFQTYSIRGVARQRVMALIDGMRITSERRAGVSASFVDPLLMKSIEVVRGPATTFYGSGALGGVVQVFPKRYDALEFALGWQGNDGESHQQVGWGGDSYSFGLAHRDAGRGEAGNDATISTAFEQWSMTFQKEWSGRDERDRYTLTIIPTFSQDIEKANRDFPQRFTTYPLERHQMVRFDAELGQASRANVWLHHHDLETRVDDRDALTINRVFNETLDFGAGFERDVSIADVVSLRVGAMLFGRQGVEALEDARDVDPMNPASPTVRTRTIDDADETELGLYGALQWDWGPSEWEAGGRISYQEQQNNGFGGSEADGLNGFAGVRVPVGSHWELRGSVASGLRFPSLGERFFGGTTGAGQVVRNPGLDEERAFTSEIGLRWIGGDVVLNGVLFRNEISDYIERVTLDNGARQFQNLIEGTIEGVELQGLWSLSDRWLLNWGGHTIEGDAQGGADLADIPADEVYAGASRRRGRWNYSLRWTHRFEKNDPGAGELPIDRADLVDASLRLAVSRRFDLVLRGSNLLDARYFSTADDLSTLARGRTIAFGVQLGGN